MIKEEQHEEISDESEDENRMSPYNRKEQIQNIKKPLPSEVGYLQH